MIKNDYVSNSGMGVIAILQKNKFLRATVRRVREYRSNIRAVKVVSEGQKKLLNDTFHLVEVETINRCNGECAFCPVNKHDDPRELKKMSEELFTKIMSELGEMDYDGELFLYSNNEPFIDTRIIDFAKEARKTVPKAWIGLYTNGSLLTEEKILSIIPYLNEMVIDNYNDKLELNETSKLADRLCKENPELDKIITIAIRKQHEVLSNRGGAAPNKGKARKALKQSCLLPFMQMVIRPDGKVSLCCNDALGKMTMGDCNKQSLLDIWRGDQFMDIRQKLLVGRDKVDMCRYCDTKSLSPRYEKYIE